MSTPRTRTATLAYLRDQAATGARFDVGLCLQRVRMAYGIAARFPDAASAWAGAAHKHPTTDLASIPAGVPVFWTGGAHGYGHVAVKAGGDTVDVWSTDLERPGHFDRVDGRRIGATWGLRLVGWTEDLNGVRVYTPAPPKPAPKPAPAPAARPIRPNHVTEARKLIDQARRELLATPSDRRVVRTAAATLATLLRVLPRS